MMKKRILSVLVVMAIALSFVTLIAGAEEMKYDDYLYYEVNQDNTVTITRCDNSVRTVRIPSEINGMSVTTIGSKAFYNCKSLIRIEIPKSIKSVEKEAFVDLEEAFYLGSRAEWEQVDIDRFYGFDGYGYGNWRIQPDSDAMRYNTPMPNDDETVGLLEYLELDRLSGTIVSCDKNIEGNLVIPSVIDRVKIKEISDDAFSGCDKLTSIVISEGVTYIGEDAFYNCSSLASIKMPDTVTELGKDAFYNCSSLTNIRISKAVPSIGEGTFSNCSSLKSVVIPNSVTNIDEYAFAGCASLQSITLSNKLKSIGENVFSDCTSLESIRIPSSAANIAPRAFEYCTALKSVYIEDGITTIGEEVFSGCEGLVNVRIPKSVTKVEESAFGMCYAVEKVYYLGDSNSWSKIKFEEDNYSVEEDAEIIYGEMPENLIVAAVEEPDEPEETTKPEEPKPTEKPAETKSSDEVSVTLNGNDIVFDQPPVIIDGRTLVPMRAIFEAMGCDVKWDGETKTIEAFNADGDKVIEMQVGSENMWSAGNPSITLDVPPQIINDRTLVPVRAISESMGAEVNWDGDTRNVGIIYN